MKKLLLAGAVAAMFASGPAMAADMPVKAPPAAPAAPPFSWTGIYIGAEFGGGWGSKNWTFDVGTSTSHNTSSFLAGGEIGFNYQVGAWVFGVEGDGLWMTLTGQSVCPNHA